MNDTLVAESLPSRYQYRKNMLMKVALIRKEENRFSLWRPLKWALSLPSRLNQADVRRSMGLGLMLASEPLFEDDEYKALKDSHLALISVRKLAQNPKIPATERKVLVARYEDGTVAYIDDLCIRTEIKCISARERSERHTNRHDNRPRRCSDDIEVTRSIRSNTHPVCADDFDIASLAPKTVQLPQNPLSCIDIARNLRDSYESKQAISNIVIANQNSNIAELEDLDMTPRAAIFTIEQLHDDSSYPMSLR